MATYGTDLTTLTDAESGGTWTELNSPYNAGGTPASDGENYIQGTDCISQTTGSKTGLLFSIVYDAGSDISGSFTTNDVVLIWVFYAVGPNLETYANGGLRAVISSDLTNADAWTVGGSNYGRNPYGGWQNVAVDPTLTADFTIGSGTGGAWRYFGTMPYTLNAIAKGTPHAVDAIRYGRGEIYCTGTGCDFAGMAQYNDYNDATNGYNRFGLFQETGGYYLWKGLMSLGQSGTSATFSDSNKVIIIDDAAKTYFAFNKIMVNNTSSSITWNNITFIALGTVSPGSFDMTSGATVNMTGCSFNGMGTFFLYSGLSALSCTFNRCYSLWAAEAVDLTGSKILQSAVVADDGALIWSPNTDPDGYLDNMEFSKGTNAHHAIEFENTIPSSITLRGIDFGTDWNASNGQNDSTLNFLDSSGTITVNLVGCSGTITYKSAGATINLVIDPVTTTITVKDVDSGSVVEGARVLLLAADATGDLPYQASMSSLIRSAGTADTTATTLNAATDSFTRGSGSFVTDGFAIGDYVTVTGFSDSTNNGSWEVTSVAALTLGVKPIGDRTGSPATESGDGDEQIRVWEALGTASAAHGLSVGDFVEISGSGVSTYYTGVFYVESVPTTTTFRYQVTAYPPPTAGGTPVFTGGIFNTLTNASGQVTDSRSLSNDQPVTGRVRKATTSPYYKNSPIDETIDNANGLSITVYVIPDE